MHILLRALNCLRVIEAPTPPFELVNVLFTIKTVWEVYFGVNIKVHLCKLCTLYFTWKTRGNPEDDLIKMLKQTAMALETELGLFYKSNIHSRL